MRRVKSFDDVYMDYIWLGFGIGLGMLIFVINVMGNQWEAMASTYLKATGNKSSFQLYEFVTPLLLIIYGIPTFTTGAACRFTPMLWGGILCWVCCAVAAFTRADIDMLLMAFSAVFAWLIPGILMEKDYRIAKKELEKSNV
jgi:hypothetical protein